MSRPIIGIGVAEAEPGEDTDAAPEVIAELMGEIGVRICPCVLVYVGGAVDAEAVHRVDGPGRLNGGHAHHYLGTGELSDPSGVPSHGGRIVRAGNHAASESRASGAEVGQGKSFRLGFSSKLGSRQQAGGKPQGGNPFHSLPCFVRS